MNTTEPVLFARWGARLVSLMLVLLLSACWQAAAAPVNSQKAAAAVKGWLKADQKPLGEALGSTVDRVESFKNKAGAEIYYVVYLQPSGFVIVAGDDLVEPIVGFAPAGRFDPSEDNPLGALVSRDLSGRVEHARRAGAAPDKAQLQAKGKWRRLEYPDDGGTVEPKGLTGVSDVRIAPLTQSTWNQGSVGSSTCYNYYTPYNYPAGCVATATAQLMRYYQFPTTSIGTASFEITVDSVSVMQNLRGGDGMGGPYVWGSMPLMPSSPSVAERQAIGALVADVGTRVGMDYTASGSASSLADAKTGLVSTFHYNNAIWGWNNNSDISASLPAMINPNLDARYPVLLSIRGSGGHAVVADGYGYSGSTLYHHLNLGWGGAQTAWYALPIVDASPYFYNTVDGCVYNTYTNGTGEIISGRVLDQLSRPVINATVTATRTGGGTYTTTTDSQGIYALARIPSASTYSISVTKPGFSTVSGSFSTGASSDWSITTGNYWGANFTMNMLPTALDHLVWSPVTGTPAVNTPFAVSIMAQNYANAPATGFAGPVALSAYASGVVGLYNVLGSLSPSAYYSSEITVGYAVTPNTNIQVTAVRCYSGDKVSIWTDTGTLLVSQNVSSAGSWVTASLATPISLSAGTTYRVSTHNPAGGRCYINTTASWPTTFANGTIGQSHYFSSGDAFPTTVNGSGGPLVDFQYRVAFSNSIPVNPTTSGTFVDGTWNGNISLSQAATNVVLKADDGAGHTASSNPFNVVDPSAGPPTITSHPQSRTNNTGDTVTFTVTATSGSTPGYSWRRNGAIIAGANASSYTLVNVQMTNSGSQYACVVNNSYGSVTSQTATLTVICTNVVVAAKPQVTLSSGGYVNAVAPLPDGAVIFGGFFTSVNGVTRNYIARLSSDGSLDTSWNPGANGEVYALAVSETNLYVGGAFTSIGGQSRNYIAKLSTSGTGGVDTVWNPLGADWSVAALALNGGALYAGGGFWYMGSYPRSCVAKLSATGTGAVDATWNPNVDQNGYVYSLAVRPAVTYPGDVFIGGTFTNVSGLSRKNLAKLGALGTGAADPTWNPNPNDDVYAVAVKPYGADVFVGGTFTYIGGQSRPGIAKLTSTGPGAADSTWNPGADGAVYSLALNGLCVYAGGYFDNIGGLYRAGLARLSVLGAGGADPAWEADCDGPVLAVAGGASALYAGGGFTQVAGQTRPRIAALTYAPLRLLAPQRAGGQFQATLTGERGQAFEIQTSANLASWSLLRTLTNSTGTTNFTDSAGPFSGRFYRARQVP